MAAALACSAFLLLPGRLLGRLLGLKLAAFSVGLGGFSLTSDRFRLSARSLGFGPSASLRFRIKPSFDGSFFRRFFRPSLVPGLLLQLSV
jgi:hypothetical protein